MSLVYIASSSLSGPEEESCFEWYSANLSVEGFLAANAVNGSKNAVANCSSFIFASVLSMLPYSCCIVRPNVNEDSLEYREAHGLATLAAGVPGLDCLL